MSDQSREMEEFENSFFHKDSCASLSSEGKRCYCGLDELKDFIQANFIPISVLEGFIKGMKKPVITEKSLGDVVEMNNIRIYNQALDDFSTVIKKQSIISSDSK